MVSSKTKSAFNAAYYERMDVASSNETPTGEQSLFGTWNDRFVADLDGRFPWDASADLAHCPVLMLFYASWCPHCIVFGPNYSNIAVRVEDSGMAFAYTVAAVDCAAYAQFCEDHKIDEYPMVRDFAEGKKMLATKNVDLESLEGNRTTLWKYLVQANDLAVRRLGKEKASNCAQARSKVYQNNSELANKTGNTSSATIPHPNRVWLADQHRALFQSLSIEAIRTGAFSLNRTLLRPLQAFVGLAAKAFPDFATRDRLKKDVAPVLDSISSREKQAGDEQLWTTSLAWLEPAKAEKGEEYFGCRGSLPHKRGYTCALWQTFHALLANLRTNTSMVSHPDVTHGGLAAIHGWIQHFFGCSECRHNFMEMSEKMEWTNVNTDDAAVIWLWKAHNAINERLKNDTSADPAWPKIQFPGPKACPECFSNLNASTFEHKRVLAYLRTFYAVGAQWTQSGN